MPAFNAPPSVKIGEPEKKDEPIVSTGQAITALGVAALIVLASRGRVSPSRAEFLARKGIEGIVGLSLIHLGTQVPGHGPGRESEVTLTNPAKPPTLAEALALLKDRVSPSGRYATFVLKSSGAKLQIPIEDLQILVEAGLLPQREADKFYKAAGVVMTKLWAADP